MVEYKYWIVEDVFIRSKIDPEYEFGIPLVLSNVVWAVNDMKKFNWYEQKIGVEFLTILKIFI